MVDNKDHIIALIRDFVESSFEKKYEIYDITLEIVDNEKVLCVYIDNSESIKVSDCEAVSRALSDYLDNNDCIDGPFTLEVSSPGAERVFKREVDFIRNVGKLVKWTIFEPDKERKEVFQARLKEYSPERIVVESRKGLREFPKSIVKEAQVVFEFPARIEREHKGRK